MFHKRNSAKWKEFAEQSVLQHWVDRSGNQSECSFSSWTSLPYNKSLVNYNDRWDLSSISAIGSLCVYLPSSLNKYDKKINSYFLDVRGGGTQTVIMIAVLNSCHRKKPTTQCTAIFNGRNSRVRLFICSRNFLQNIKTSTRLRTFGKW